MNVDELTRRLKRNLTTNVEREKSRDHKHDLIAFCVENSYRRADLIEVDTPFNFYLFYNL
jgi:hypothetical protein